MRLAGENDARGNLGMAGAEALDNGESRVIGGAAGEENFKGGIVLKEKALEVLFEARLGSVQWLEDGDGGEVWWR